MTDLDHRFGVKEANLVVRYLKLEGITPDNKNKLVASIDLIIGIDSVSYDESARTLKMAYDASHCDLDLFERLIQAQGADLSQGIWTRVKEGFYKYVDQNVKDNAEHDPYCNNALPKALPGSRKR
ncbi:cation transporter [Shewanella psychropiezotolerans]|uniref:Cation transporter n=1 Tax=Shewanella psychropiezotolerans TaxID=2593655 RepID=A0ABX5WYV1_9GAMM|nr:MULTISPECIES: cation transporter [Shewanella]MPY24029.1 cation transporter [Shewanella sp. YLB-07]QDO84278.1 cation transporter [Shewanella psychropiezotolerans]